MTPSSNRSTEYLEKFGVWLTGKWRGSFEHFYAVTPSRHWAYFRNTHQTDIWKCRSLEDALGRYSWGNGGYQQNSAELSAVAARLQAAIQSGDQTRTCQACADVLLWGGVFRKTTVEWLDGLAAKDELCSRLSSGIEALKSGNSEVFDGQFLRMNSGTTKIFSLADTKEEIVIYDGRVGAALGLLVRLFCVENQINELPDELAFLWGASRDGKHNRNPSTKRYAFPKLGVGVQKDQKHAEMVIRTSALLNDAAKASNASVRDWEAALFMIGYELPRSAS